jgi:peptidyl-prolyl cis-trans isomerase B (cyclophilin B)
VTVVLRTSQGDIPLTLDRAEAPCHRLTADETLKVLKCGDPTGTGEGGPGYTIPDENPTTLAPAPDARPGTPVDVYPAGTVAMANTGEPDSGGSQFFLVYADSELPPTYAVFGSTGADGLATLNKIAAGGIEARQSAQDGTPRLPVTITRASVSD